MKIVMDTITVYRLQDKEGDGPITSLTEGNKYTVNPHFMDSYVRFQQGDDPFQFKYACTSMRNLEIYFGKKNLQGFLKEGYKIVVERIPSNLVRYAKTKKICAYKFTDEEMFPMKKAIAIICYTNKQLEELRKFKNQMLTYYYMGNYHENIDYYGQFGFLEFCKDYGYLIDKKSA